MINGGHSLELSLLQSLLVDYKRGCILTVNSDCRLIYWTDWGLHAKIECASMDGSNRKVVVNESLTWPNGIAIDYEYMRLYWADAKYDKIERSNLDGSDRTTMLQDPQMPHIFGFDVSGMQYIIK